MTTPPDWPSAPGPVDRVSFFEEQRRNRQATWRLSLVSLLSVLLMGLPFSLAIMPALYAVLLFSLELIALFVPLPTIITGTLGAFGQNVLGEMERWTSSNQDLPPVSLLAPLALALLAPGVVLAILVWLWLRALFLRSGVGGILLSLGARDPRLDDLEEQQLVNLVEEMALAAGVPPPRVCLIDTPAANAAAIGSSPHDSTVVVSRALLGQLDRDETQGVIGHLIGSVGNGDLRLALTLSAVFQAFGLLLLLLNVPFGPRSRLTFFRLLKFVVWPTGKERHQADAELIQQMLVGGLDISGDDLDRWLDSDKVKNAQGWRSAAQLPLLFCFGWPAMTAKFLFAFFDFVLVGPVVGRLWRTRRNLADATAVQLTRNPDGLARALAKLDAGGEVPGGGGAAHLFVVWPASADRSSTTSHRAIPAGVHVKLADRERRLRAMGAHNNFVPPPGLWQRLKSARANPLTWLLIPALVVVVGGLLALCFVLMLVALGLMLGLNLLFAEITLLGIHAVFQLLHAVLPGVRR